MILAIGTKDGSLFEKHSERIMEYLYFEYGIKGFNEDYLLGDSLIGLICESDLNTLETFLEQDLESTVTLPRDLIFIEDPRFKRKSAFDIYAETIKNPIV